METNYITNRITGEKIINMFDFIVAENDCPNSLSWNESNKLAIQMGPGWRLPDQKEIDLMKSHKDILGLNKSNYWTNEEEGNLAFSKGFKWYAASRFVIKSSRCYVRFVKSIDIVKQEEFNGNEVIALNKGIINF